MDAGAISAEADGTSLDSSQIYWVGGSGWNDVQNSEADRREEEEWLSKLSVTPL